MPTAITMTMTALANLFMLSSLATMAAALAASATPMRSYLVTGGEYDTYFLNVDVAYRFMIWSAHKICIVIV